MHRRGRLWCFLLLAAFAGSMTPVHATEDGRVGLDRVWAWLETLFPAQGFWIDPNGGAAATADQGPWIDPGGDSATSDQGLWIDPDG